MYFSHENYIFQTRQPWQSVFSLTVDSRVKKLISSLFSSVAVSDCMFSFSLQSSVFSVLSSVFSLLSSALSVLSSALSVLSSVVCSQSSVHVPHVFDVFIDIM